MDATPDMAARHASFVRQDLGLACPDDRRITLNLREVLAEGIAPRTARGAVLLVHGATLPASALFDIPGRSWLEDLAGAGFAAYGLDVRGYGRSGRGAAYGREPYARADEAVRDIGAAAAFVAARSGRQRIALLGGSWGSITCGLFAANDGRALVDRLVLYAPIFAARNPGWLAWIEDPARPGRLNPALGAFRQVTPAGIRARWQAELDAAGEPDLLEESVFAALIRATLPPGAASLSVPNGALADLLEAFTERPLYDPVAIAAPTLLIRGADDSTSTEADMAELFRRLGAPIRRAITVGCGTHFISAERNGKQVFREVRLFLEEPRET
jgi:alpha-beta hydrolase superfamily lysophospholipase